MPLPPTFDELTVRTFWASGSTADHVVSLPLPVGQRPFPVTSGDWYLRVVAYRATEAGDDGAFILVSDQALDENDRHVHLAYVNGGKTDGVVRPVGGGERYYRLRPAPGDAITFKLVPATTTTTTTRTPKFQLGVELSQRFPRPRLFPGGANAYSA